MDWSNGWNESKLEDLTNMLDTLEHLNYEIKRCVRGRYSNAYTYKELSNYIIKMSDMLTNEAEFIANLDEDDED